jgi:hypothetical protein
MRRSDSGPALSAVGYYERSADDLVTLLAAITIECDGGTL